MTDKRYNKTFLNSHFERIQRRLQAEGIAARSFDHGLNRGLIREAFIREFLRDNISELWGVGTGEIIHKDATLDTKRPQIDVIIYNKQYPKLPFAGGFDLFFSGTISSFIEIKSHLKKEDLRKTAITTQNIKQSANFAPQRMNPIGLIENPRPYSFIFAYDGPRKIETVRKWMKELAKEYDFGISDLAVTQPHNRSFYNHTFVDGVFILGKGFVVVDALPFESKIGAAVDQGTNVSPLDVFYWGKDEELLVLWAIINQVNACLTWNVENLNEYIGAVLFWIEENDPFV